MLAFSIWNAIWVVIVAFVLINLLMMLFAVVVDLFRDPELSGIAKAAWIVVLLLLPLIGMLVYVITRGGGMAERAMEKQAELQESFDAQAIAGDGAAGEIEKASVLHAAGQLSDEEYAAIKAKILD